MISISNKIMKSKLALLAAFLMVMPLGVAAKGTASDQPNFIYIPREQSITGNLYRAGETIQIDGSVDGDVVVAGGLVKINGSVTGDVLAVGGHIIINGPVQGDVRVAGGQIDLNGVIGKNLTAMGGNINITKDGAVGYEAMILGGEVDIEGQIKTDLRGSMGRLVLSGRVEHDVWVKADQLVLQPTVQIAGNLTYASGKQADVLSGAIVKGEVNFQQRMPDDAIDGRQFSRAAAGIFAGLLLIKWLGYLLLALLILRFIPKKLEKAMHELNDGVWPVLGVGLLALIGIPVAMIIVAMTVVGLPIASAMFAAYILMVLSAKVVVAIFVGQWIIRKVSNHPFRAVNLAWAAALGLAVLLLITLVPVLGWLLGALSLAFGLGAILMFERQEMRRWR